tara:strand:- start:354 stop:779 length:426 start_codon:yes stop_codon:yes gene_type:complete
MKIIDINVKNPVQYLNSRQLGVKKTYRGHRIMISGPTAYTNMWNITDLLIEKNKMYDKQFSAVYLTPFNRTINDNDVKIMNRCDLLVIIDLDHLNEAPNLDYLWHIDNKFIDARHVNIAFISTSCKTFDSSWTHIDDWTLI